jgi:hypothetical protein
LLARVGHAGVRSRGVSAGSDQGGGMEVGDNGLRHQGE